MGIISSLPESDKPLYFGLPANIDRSRQRTVSSQVREGGREGGGGREMEQEEISVIVSLHVVMVTRLLLGDWSVEIAPKRQYF